MPSNDVSAPHPQHTYAANAARLSCLLPPPPRLDIVAVSTSPSPLNDPHASRTRPAPLLPLHTTSATRVRMAKLARTYDERLGRRVAVKLQSTSDCPESAVITPTQLPQNPPLHLHTFINRAMLPFRSAVDLSYSVHIFDPHVRGSHDNDDAPVCLSVSAFAFALLISTFASVNRRKPSHLKWSQAGLFQSGFSRDHSPHARCSSRCASPPPRSSVRRGKQRR
ncbi:hypothetical protein R3P38DRAFT_3206671 [Favolaschia claudopus]|uniref:Uncharacterized protein n=1 Tax=Favolaschia claudopus TaxID=2862362 RepID=A0AAW0AJU9_9AGAR